MAGRIRDEDVALVRERTSIADVVSEYVTLKPAGGGNVKGLCPFHDEKTPSFNVAAAKGVYFCYGCGAGGDSITFLMTLEHLSFIEAVERLATKAGVQLRYAEAGPAPVRAQQGQRQRLIAANEAAARALLSALLDPYVAERGKAEWIEATPRNLVHASLLARLFPAGSGVRSVRSIGVREVRVPD